MRAKGANLYSADIKRWGSQPTYSTMERRTQSTDQRKKPRIACKYPASVQIAAQGSKHQEDAEVVNLSANGLQLCSVRPFEEGTELFVRVRLSNKPQAEFKGPEIAMNCTVVWSKPHPDGICGTGVKIDRYRFL